MQFEFDNAKSASNLQKHGIDLRDAADVFRDPHRLDLADRRKDYGEERRIVIGALESRTLVVVYTPRADVIRLISARKTNEREQQKYHALRT